jgi:hypothetical protein
MTALQAGHPHPRRMRLLPAPPRMTAQEARDHIARLGISQQALVRLIMGSPTTVRRWLNIENPLDIPQAVAISCGC